MIKRNLSRNPDENEWPDRSLSLIPAALPHTHQYLIIIIMIIVIVVVIIESLNG